MRWHRDSSLLTPKISAKFQLGHPKGGAKSRSSLLEWTIFDHYFAIPQKLCDTIMRSIEWRYWNDTGSSPTTQNHRVFHILYLFSYLHSGQRS